MFCSFAGSQKGNSSLRQACGEPVIEMDAWLAHVLRGRRWHPSQVVEELPGGGSHLKLRLSWLEQIEQHVLAM